MATTRTVEKGRKPQAAEEVGSAMPQFSISTSKDDLSDEQRRGLGGSVAEENDHVRDAEQVEWSQSRQGRQDSLSGSSDIRSLSRPSAEARARWAMLASLAGVSHSDYSQNARDENMPRYPEQDIDNGKVSHGLRDSEHTSAGEFLEMPNPDHFIRPLVIKNGIKIEAEQLEKAKGLLAGKISSVLDETEASVEHAVSEGASAIRSASFPEVVDGLDNMAHAAAKISHGLGGVESALSTAETATAEKIGRDVQEAHDAVAKANFVLEDRLQSDLPAMLKGAKEISKAAVDSIISSVNDRNKEKFDHRINKSSDLLRPDGNHLSGEQEARHEMPLKTQSNENHDHKLGHDSVAEAKACGKRMEEGLDKITPKPGYKGVEKHAANQQSRPHPEVDNKGNHSRMSSQHPTSAVNGQGSSKTNPTVFPNKIASETASHAPSSARPKNAATDVINQQKTPLAEHSRPLKVDGSDANSIRLGRGVQSPDLHKATQNRQQVTLQQAPGHLMKKAQDNVEKPNQNRMQKISDPGQSDFALAKPNRTKPAPAHNDSKAGLTLSGGESKRAVKQDSPETSSTQRRIEPNRIPSQEPNLVGSQAETHPIRPATQREGQRTIQDHRIEPVRSAVAVDKPTSAMRGLNVSSSPLSAMPQRDYRKQAPQHQQRQEPLPVVGRPFSTGTTEIALAQNRTQPRRGGHPGAESSTPQNVVLQRDRNNGSLGVLDHSPRRPSSNSPTPVHVFSDSYRGAQTTPAKKVEYDEPNSSMHENQAHSQEIGPSSCFLNEPTLEASNKADVNLGDAASESPQFSGASPEGSQAWPPSNMVEHSLDPAEEGFGTSDMKPPSAENIVNGIESFLDTFEQQQQMTIDHVKNGQAGFLDTMIQLVVDMARDAMPEVRRRLEENGFVTDSDEGVDVQ